MSTFTIQLHQLRLYGYHGVHPEERKIGAPFELNLDLCINEPAGAVSLDNTINYADVFQVVKELFATPQPLLEQLAVAMAAALASRYPALQSLRIQITKLVPPIAGYTGRVGVVYEKTFGP